MGYFQQRALSGGFAADGSVIPTVPKNTGIVPPAPEVIVPIAAPASASIFTTKNLLIAGGILAVGYFAAGALLLRK